MDVSFTKCCTQGAYVEIIIIPKKDSIMSKRKTSPVKAGQRVQAKKTRGTSRKTADVSDCDSEAMDEIKAELERWRKKQNQENEVLQKKYEHESRSRKQMEGTLLELSNKIDSLTQKLNENISGAISDQILGQIQDKVKPVMDRMDIMESRLPPSTLTQMAVTGGSSTSPLTPDTIQKELPKASRDALRNFIRFRWYWKVKFMTREQAEVVLKAGRREKKLDDNVTSYKHVLNELGCLRQNSRAGAKASFVGKNVFVDTRFVNSVILNLS